MPNPSPNRSPTASASRSSAGSKSSPTASSPSRASSPTSASASKVLFLRPDQKLLIFQQEVAAFPEYYAQYFKEAMMGGAILPIVPVVCTGPVKYGANPGANRYRRCEGRRQVCRRP